MQKIYDAFKDVAEFRMVYIREAHAADSNWPVSYAKELEITEHKDYGQRCQTAEKFLSDKKFTLPCLIDGMDNKVNEAYKGWPDRIFLVRKDGVLAVAGKRGPWGFGPALDECQVWLAAYKKTGKEPKLPAVKKPETEPEKPAEAEIKQG
jgi:hypothetical protein